MRSFFKRFDKVEETKLLVIANLVVLSSDVFDVFGKLSKFMSGVLQ